MDELKTKAAVPIPPVGADGEQPVHKTTDHSITEDLTENNPRIEQAVDHGGPALVHILIQLAHRYGMQIRWVAHPLHQPQLFF